MLLKIVDAFADNLFGGNTAGVVIIKENESFPTDDVMLKTAAELRYSETAFVKKAGDNRFRIRYFTPVAEVELCGHATIASFHALLEEGMVEDCGQYVAETLQGELNIYFDIAHYGQIQNSLLRGTVEDDYVEKCNDTTIRTVMMDMAKPRLYEYIHDKPAVDELYTVMGIKSEGQGVYSGNPRLNLFPRIVSTGLKDIMLPVADVEELNRISPDFNALAELSKRYNVVGFHAFTCNSTDGRIHARNFAPLYGIDEEAATGTSNGALAVYLFDYGIMTGGREKISVIQGEKMKRPSSISVSVSSVNQELSVKVGGRAVTLVSGSINL